MTGNLTAFLEVIKHCEGTAGPNGERMLFGGGLFDSFADHPRIIVEKSGYRSSAAGWFQILQGTWDDFIKANGPHDFSPDSQVLCARWLIGRRGATADVEAGRLEAALAKCGKEWASLPGSPYGQPTRTLEYCQRVYREAGGMPDSIGVTKPSTAVAVTSRKSMDPLSAVSLIGSLVQMFAPKVAAKVEGVIGTPQGAPLLNTLMGIAQAETGQTNPKAAIGLAEGNPAIVAKMESAAVDWLAQVAPLLDKMDAYERGMVRANTESMDAAGERGRKDSLDLAPPIAGYMAGLCALTLLFLFAVMGMQAWFLPTHEPTTAMLTLIGPLLGGVFGSLATIVAYRFGEKRNSSAAEASQQIAYKLAERV